MLKYIGEQEDTHTKLEMLKRREIRPLSTLGFTNKLINIFINGH